MTDPPEETTAPAGTASPTEAASPTGTASPAEAETKAQAEAASATGEDTAALLREVWESVLDLRGLPTTPTSSIWAAIRSPRSAW